MAVIQLGNVFPLFVVMYMHHIHVRLLSSPSQNTLAFVDFTLFIFNFISKYFPQGSPPPPYGDISSPDSLSSPLLLEMVIDVSGEFWIGVVCNILMPGSFRNNTTKGIHVDLPPGKTP